MKIMEMPCQLDIFYSDLTDEFRFDYGKRSRFQYPGQEKGKKYEADTGFWQRVGSIPCRDRAQARQIGEYLRSRNSRALMIELLSGPTVTCRLLEKFV